MITVDTPRFLAQHFQKCVWAFGPFIEGLKHYHLVLSVDETHLYKRYGEILLVAIGLDVNGGLFPLAFAVIDVEDTNNQE